MVTRIVILGGGHTRRRRVALYYAPPTKSRWRTRRPSPPSEAKPQPHWEAMRTDGSVRKELQRPGVGGRRPHRPARLERAMVENLHRRSVYSSASHPGELHSRMRTSHPMRSDSGR